MGKAHAPRRGTLQFWHRVRSVRETARIRNWVISKDAKPLGFLGYKVGMCHAQVIDNRPKGMTKGEEISIPATVVECPPLKVIAAHFYKNQLGGLHTVSTVLSLPFDKELARALPVAKKTQKIEDVKHFDDVRLLVATQPSKMGFGTKKPKVAEIALGGTKDQKLKYAQEKLGKEITINEVFSAGNLTDIHAITKGKGFQGPVKRHGVMLRHHKSEKSRRANVRGAWGGPSMWTAPHSGRLGYQQRVDYNKLVLKIGDHKEFASDTFHKYGLVKNPFLLIKGSVAGSKKRVITFTQPMRPNKKVPKDAPVVKMMII